jgi:hypothetical protein
MTLRIISENSARNLERSLHTGRDIGGSLQDTYMTRLTKLVPAEAITAYPLFINTIPNNQRNWQGVLLVAAVILVVVMVLRWSATKGPDGKAQWPAVILSAISFVIWVFVMGANSDFATLLDLSKVAPGIQPQLLSSLALFAWTAIAPALYTGDRL